MSKRAVVVGGGIVGLSTAFYLNRLGWGVTLIDKAQPGHGCSAGNAGSISPGSVVPLGGPGTLAQVPQMLWDRNGALTIPWSYSPFLMPWLIAFLKASSKSRAQEISDQLQPLLEPTLEGHIKLLASIGASELLKSTGQLHVYPDRNAQLKDSFGWALRRSHNVQVIDVDRRAILELEPSIGPRYTVGYFLPEQGMIIDPFKQVERLATALVEDGVSIVRDEVRSASVEGRKAVGVETASGHHSADAVVICAGAWSQVLLASLGIKVPLESQRGYHATLHSSGISLRRPVVAADRKMFSTPMLDGLRVAGTVEFGGLQRPPDMRRAEILLQHCKELFPEANVSSPSLWMGHRPCLPDSLPVMGQSKQVSGLWFNFGHGHLGLTMGPSTGELVARGVSGLKGYIDLDAFSIERF